MLGHDQQDVAAPGQRAPDTRTLSSCVRGHMGTMLEHPKVGLELPWVAAPSLWVFLICSQWLGDHLQVRNEVFLGGGFTSEWCESGREGTQVAEQHGKRPHVSQVPHQEAGAARPGAAGSSGLRGPTVSPGSVTNAPEWAVAGWDELRVGVVEPNGVITLGTGAPAQAPS